MDGGRVVEESWYDVEKEGISHVRSTEEIAELLADAATEKSRDILAEQQQSLLMTSKSEFVETEESPLEFNVSSGPVHQPPTHSEKQGFLNSLIVCFKDFIKSLSNPAFIASHLAALGLGIFIGRRLV